MKRTAKRIGAGVARLAKNRRLRLRVESTLLIVTVLTALILVGLHGATALHVRVVREVRSWDISKPRPQDNVLIFDKTYTDLGLVREVQDEFNGLPNEVWGGGVMGQFDYRYTFSFSTLGFVTQVYSGTDADVTGKHTLYGVPVSLSPPSPWQLLHTLRDQLGIPTEGDWIP